MLHRLHKKITLGVQLGEAWDFFSNPANLALITPAELNFQITTELPKQVYPGAIIAYKVHPLLGIPLTWVTEITQVKEMEYFIDEQRYGPYRMWHHQHFFRETSAGLEVEDIVDYILPFNFIGEIAHALFIKKQLDSIFDYRTSYLLNKWPI